jgi:hypothetical protein
MQQRTSPGQDRDRRPEGDLQVIAVALGTEESANAMPSKFHV